MINITDYKLLMSKPPLPKELHAVVQSISLRPVEWALLDKAAEKHGLYRSAVVRVLIRQAVEARLPIFRRD